MEQNPLFGGGGGDGNRTHEPLACHATPGLNRAPTAVQKSWWMNTRPMRADPAGTPIHAGWLPLRLPLVRVRSA